jgi:DNA polymerase II small subunit
MSDQTLSNSDIELNIDKKEESTEKIIERIMTYAITKQIVVSKEALLEMSNTNYIDIINEADEQGIFVISKEFVLEFIENHPEHKQTKEEKEETSLPTEILRSIKIPAADEMPDLIIPDNGYNQGYEEYKCDISDFNDYFLEKFKELKKILMKHNNISPISSKALKFTKEGENVCLIGMVYEKRLSKKGNTVIKLDDNDGDFKIIITQNGKLKDFDKQIIIDDVIAIRGKYLGNFMIVAEEIEYPTTTNTTMKKSKRDLNLLITSDIHLGSKLFYEDSFKNFIEWLNARNVSSVERDEINKIKYIILNGDNVDGIGVYPQQLTELSIIDINEQYETLANYLQQIPEHIEILITPGNHDAIRLADPQPPITKQFAKRLHSMKNVHMIGSPSRAIIEGMNVLMYHGNSMNTMQFQLKIDPTKPELAMEQYLKRRTLSPVYGERHITAPDKKSLMIIKDEPDIFITGHIHSNAYKYVNGTLTINPGCWQAQTVYQREQGHIPTPGRVPIVQLNKGIYFEKIFKCGDDLA